MVAERGPRPSFSTSERVLAILRSRISTPRWGGYETCFSTVEMAGVGVPPGLAGAGFGAVGEARVNFNRMVKGMTRLKGISENAAGDQLNFETYVKKLSDVSTEILHAAGSMFEQEHPGSSTWSRHWGAVEQEEAGPSTPGASWRTKPCRT
jgi:hypothetical protein